MRKLLIVLGFCSMLSCSDATASSCAKRIPLITRSMVNGGYSVVRRFSQTSEFAGRAEFYADRGPRASLNLIVVVLDQSLNREDYVPASADDTGLTCILENGKRAAIYKFMTLAE